MNVACSFPCIKFDFKSYNHRGEFDFAFLLPDAAEILRQNRRLFEQNVARSMRGGYIGSVYFERCMK